MQDSPDAQHIIIANALPEVNGQTTEKKRAHEKKTGNFSSHHRGVWFPPTARFIQMRRGCSTGTLYLIYKPDITKCFTFIALYLCT